MRHRMRKHTETNSPSQREVGSPAATDSGLTSEPVYARKRKPRRRDPNQRDLPLEAQAVERDAAAPALPSEAGQGDEPLYLSSGKRCAQDNVVEDPLLKFKSVNVISPCKCASWYCPDCQEAKGWKLKRRLKEALNLFERGVYGITLTIDGSLYATPYEAWKDVMRRRLIARLVQKLHQKGHLASRAFFWVVEFQKGTKQPHWHVLVDAKRIPFGLLVELWSACRPRSAPKLPERITAKNYKDHPPAFGSVRYSFKTGRASSAANYACKYLIKQPVEGFPGWVLDHEGRVPRYGRSRGFFPVPECNSDGERVKESKGKTGFRAVHGPDCFCDVCRGDVIDQRVQKRSLKTIRDRLDACGGRSMLTHADAVEQEDGSLAICNRRFGRMIDVPFALIKDQLASSGSGERSVVRDIGYDPDLHQLETSYYLESDCEEDGGW